MWLLFLVRGNGFNQAIELCAEILANEKFIQEKNLVGKYLEGISQDTGNWNLFILHDKVFNIIVDDVFIDDSVISNVKTSLWIWNKDHANWNLFVVCSEAPLLDQVIPVGLDELHKVMEKSAKCPKYAQGSHRSAMQYPNIKYAASPEDWSTSSAISEILEPSLPEGFALFRNAKLLHQAAASTVIRITFMNNIQYLHNPWDPGGINTMHRLEGEPNFKKGGMLGDAYGTVWAGEYVRGLVCRL